MSEIPSFSEIPWDLGAMPEAWGTKVWFSRVENLRGHLKLIEDYLPEDSDWLRNQVNSAISVADGYLRDWRPSAEDMA